MEILVILVPAALMLGFVGLVAFLWSLQTGQFDDLDGAPWRALQDDEALKTTRPPTGNCPAAHREVGMAVATRPHQLITPQVSASVATQAPIGKGATSVRPCR